MTNLYQIDTDFLQFAHNGGMMFNVMRKALVENRSLRVSSPQNTFMYVQIRLNGKMLLSIHNPSNNFLSRNWDAAQGSS